MMIETHASGHSGACLAPASSSTNRSLFLKIPQVLSALGCKRRQNTSSHQSEVAGTALALPSSLSPQRMAESLPSELPEAVLAVVLDFAGPAAWYAASCASNEWHQVFWQSPTIWSSALLSLGEEPGRVEQDVCRQRDRTRKVWFGITNFIMQGAQPSVPCDAMLIGEATRAIKGLRNNDSVEEIDPSLERCVGLLRTFPINDTMARDEAIKLQALIVARTDLFNPEQCQRATDALAEATELGDLLDDALQMQDLLDLDSFDEDGIEALAASTGAWCCEEEQDEGLADSEVSEEALDRLLSVLRDAVVSQS